MRTWQEDVKHLLSSESSGWHHPESVAARLRLDPITTTRLMARMHEVEGVLDRAQTKGKALAVHNHHFVEVDGVYYKYKEQS